MSHLSKKYGVITGASQGLGMAFAKELASQNLNLILVSLPGQQLAQKASQLMQEHDVEVQFYETDLTVKENVITLCQWLNAQFDIYLLKIKMETHRSTLFIGFPALFLGTRYRQ